MPTRVPINLDKRPASVEVVSKKSEDSTTSTCAASKVVKRHQSLPSVLHSSNSLNILTSPLFSPQKINALSAKATPEKVLPSIPLRQLSPPTPKKFQNDKENEKRTHQSKIDTIGQQSTNKASGTRAKKGSNAKAAVQAKVTDFFAVRRSERRPKVESEALQQKQIEERLKLDHDEGLGLEVKEIPEKGRGIFPTREFSKGEFVVEYAGDLIDIKEAKEREADYSMDLAKGCYMYYFKTGNKQYCIDATKETGRLGRLVNHSRQTPNLRTKVIMLDGIPRLVLVALRDVQVGEELLYDYGDRSKESLASHPWLAL